MAKREPEKLLHCFAPVYDARSRVLVLGSFPSARSRAEGFYYGHPRNRFWPMLARVFETDIPKDNGGRRALLLQNGVALWDVAASCEITGSSDASIRGVVANDIARVLAACDIKEILANGAAAARLFRALCERPLGREITALPSTSPANAAWSLERLCAEWRSHLTDKRP